MTEMFLTIKKDGQEITFSDEEVAELIDQLDDMMSELADIDHDELIGKMADDAYAYVLSQWSKVG